MNLDEAKGVLYRAAGDDAMRAVDDHDRPYVSREVQEQAAWDILVHLEGPAWDEGLSEDGRRRMIGVVVAAVKTSAIEALNEFHGLDIPLGVIEE